MGLFFNDREGQRQSVVHSATSDVVKQTSKYTDAATRPLAPKPSRGAIATFLRSFVRRGEVADMEAAHRMSGYVSGVQDNVIHMQTGFARGMNEVERLQNENEQLHLERMKIERTVAALERQNFADAATFPTLLKTEQLSAETKRLEALSKAVTNALRLGIDASYLFEESFGVDAGVDAEKSIPVLQAEREKVEKLREKAQAEARIADEKLTFEGERVRKEKRNRAERLAPIGASDAELEDRANLVVDEAIKGTVEPDSPDRYLHAFAGATYIHELIIGTSFVASRKATYDAVLRALKQDITGERRATRDLALIDLKVYYDRKAEYEQITRAGGISDLVSSLSGGRGDGLDPLD
jgi:FtsZ-binding cell division protein ZapB